MTIEPDAVATQRPGRVVFGLLGAMCLAVSVHQVGSQWRAARPCGEDAISGYHRRMRPLHEALAGRATAGYVGDAVSGYGDLTRDEVTGLLWAQHWAVPTLLRPGVAEACVVVNFHGADAVPRARAHGLRADDALAEGLGVVWR